MPLSHKDDTWSSPRFNTMIVAIAKVPCQKTVWSVWPPPTVAKPLRLEPDQGRRTGCTRDIGAATKRGLWAMHAEPGEFMGQAYSKAPIVTGNVPRSPSAALISTDPKETGLWLWQGEVLPSPPGPKSRDRQFLRRIMPAAGWAGWIALPAGLALAFLTVSMIPRPDRPISKDRPAVALSSAPSPTVPRPIASVLPAEVTEAKLDRAQVPSAPPAAKLTAQLLEPPVLKGRAQHKLSRSARKNHASHVRKRPLFPTPGVLTPPTTWHGGGY